MSRIKALKLLTLSLLVIFSIVIFSSQVNAGNDDSEVSIRAVDEDATLEEIKLFMLEEIEDQVRGTRRNHHRNRICCH